MKSFGFGFIISLLFAMSAFGFSDVDFDHSNGFDRMKQYSLKYTDKAAEKQVELLRQNYEKLRPSKAPSSINPIIPKVIHQIWLGESSIPANYKYYLETWKKHHPNWEIKLWTEKEIIAENFPSMDLFYKARSYAGRSDIIRYEILYRYGGLYIDTDVECFKNFDDLHHKYHFYANMEPPPVNKQIVSIANMMIGSIPKHPILRTTLENLRKNWDKAETYFEENLSNSWSSFARSNHKLAVLQTMQPLTYAVFNFLEEHNQTFNKTIVLPAGYNIPIYLVQRHPLLSFFSKIFRGRPKLTDKVIIQPETMSFHFHNKNNSLISQMSFEKSLFNKNLLKEYIYKALNFKNKYYLAFQDLFNKNSPTKISYKTSMSIPQIIYLEKSDNLSLREQWIKLNPGFEVKILDKTNLISRFELLLKEGGIYVEANFAPLNLQEFQYKYDYYGLISPKSIFDKPMLSTQIIAIKPNHIILQNMMSNITHSTEYTDQQIQQFYLDNAYKYCQLDGKSIILPEIYFNLKR